MGKTRYSKHAKGIKAQYCNAPKLVDLLITQKVVIGSDMALTQKRPQDLFNMIIFGPVMSPGRWEVRTSFGFTAPLPDPFVLIPGFLRRTQSAPLLNLGTPSAPPKCALMNHISSTKEVS